MTKSTKDKLNKLLNSFTEHDEEEYHRDGGSIKDLYDQYEATRLVAENAKYELAQQILKMLEE